MIDIWQPSKLGRLTRDGVTLYCHFAFRDYVGRALMHWGRLRVLNRLDLDAGGTFRVDDERSIEILTLVLDGTVAAFVDGRGDVLLNPGDCHAISAGDGIALATWTARDGGASLLHLWLIPEEEGGEPEFGLRRDVVRTECSRAILASGFPEDDPEEVDQGRSGDPLPLKARARILHYVMPAGEQVVLSTRADRAVYVVVLEGHAEILGREAGRDCGVAITGCETVTVRALAPSTVIICDSD
jgi:redox-sensitive bicupin YhaK (pirin superfamily)